jgi:hypothetical protein
MPAEFEPTTDQRALVQNAAAFGINQADIANQLNIDEKTLRKHFRERRTADEAKDPGFNRDAWRVLPPIATACAGYPGKPQDHVAAAHRLRSVLAKGFSRRGSRASRGRFWRFKGHVAFW